MERISICTCSWKYPSWEHLVYSSSQPENYLAEYAQHFDMVEIDQWFWSLGKESAGLPKRETVELYHASTPDEFQFIIKCPNALTKVFHDHTTQEPLRVNKYFLNPEFMKSFIESLHPLASKIGLLVFQFGYINKEMMQNQQQFLDALEQFFSAIPSGTPYAIEIRNPKWLNGTWFTWLMQHKIAPVLLQGYWMEDINETVNRYENLIGDTISIRLHGEDREEIEVETGGNWNHLIHPRDRELGSVTQSLTMLAERGRVVYVQVNNHYEGSAPLTIERLKTLLAT